MKRVRGKKMGELLKASTRQEAEQKGGRFKRLEDRAKRADQVLGDERSHDSQPSQQKRQVLRQTVSLPPEDHALFADLVERAQRAGIYNVPLSAVARAALRMFAGLSDKELVQALRDTPPVKAGRKPNV